MTLSIAKGIINKTKLLICTSLILWSLNSCSVLAKPSYEVISRETVADQSAVIINNTATTFSVPAEQANQITFLYKVIPGGIGKSYGLEVAKRAGLPASVVNYARTLLHQLENTETIPSQPISEPNLFQNLPSSPPSEIDEALAKLDINSLTPIDALLTLKSWKERLKDD